MLNLWMVIQELVGRREASNYTYLWSLEGRPILHSFSGVSDHSCALISCNVESRFPHRDFFFSWPSTLIPSCPFIKMHNNFFTTCRQEMVREPTQSVASSSSRSSLKWGMWGRTTFLSALDFLPLGPFLHRSLQYKSQTCTGCSPNLWGHLSLGL